MHKHFLLIDTSSIHLLQHRGYNMNYHHSNSANIFLSCFCITYTHI